MERRLKLQKEAEPEWARRISEHPGCEGVFSCLQCGACSGTCPLSIYMDFGPRRIIGLVREGFRTTALSSETIWLCASCYSCAVHCPRKIHVTDIMYTLKREAIEAKLYPRRLPIPVLAQEFYRAVRSRGKNPELWVVLRMALKSHPLILLSMIHTGWALLRTGRLSLHSEHSDGIAEIKRYLDLREVA